MSFCKKPKNINADNQNRLDAYLFGPTYNPADITINNKGDRCLINIGNQGPKISTNPNCYMFSMSDRLGSGSYGTVVKYIDTNKRVAFAIKFTSSNEEEEISNALNNSNCNTLKVRHSGKNWTVASSISKFSNFSYFMELADGDLSGFLMDNNITPELKNNPKIFLDIAETIRNQLICLFRLDNKYVYTDIKLGNILYKCDENNVIHFMLGDLGSAVPSASGDYAATYPPVNFSTGLFKLKTMREKESTLAWQMGILLLLLFPFYMFSTRAQVIKYKNENTDKLTWGSIKTVNASDIEKFKVNLDQLENGLYAETALKSPNSPLFRTYIDSNLSIREKSIYTPIISDDLRQSIQMTPPQPQFVPQPQPMPQQPSPFPEPMAQQAVNLSKLTVVQLKDIAKNLGCSGYNKMRKVDLIAFLFHCKKNAGRPPVGRPPVARPPVGRPPVARPPVARPPLGRPPVVGRSPISNLSKLTVVKLRELAKKSGCKGYSKLLKAELITFIVNC
jgi:serine/threonine protein kinase